MDPNPPQSYSWIESTLKYKGQLVLISTSALKTQILRDFHSYAIEGHSRFQNTYAHARRSFFWPIMKNDIYTFIYECDICQCKHPRTLQPLPILASIWIDISM